MRSSCVLRDGWIGVLRGEGGLDLMTIYQICEDGEPVALVASRGLAERIADCQPPGCYTVDVVGIEQSASLRRLADDRRHGAGAAAAHSRSMKRSGVMLSSLLDELGELPMGARGRWQSSIARERPGRDGPGAKPGRS